MALICRDNADEPFAYLRRHTQLHRLRDTGTTPLPDAHSSRYGETEFQSSNQPHHDGANQWQSTTHRGAYYELTAFSGGIIRGQSCC